MAAVFAHGSEVLMVAGTQALGGTQVDATPLRSVSALILFFAFECTALAFQLRVYRRASIAILTRLQQYSDQLS